MGAIACRWYGKPNEFAIIFFHNEFITKTNRTERISYANEPNDLNELIGTGELCLFGKVERTELLKLSVELHRPLSLFG